MARPERFELPAAWFEARCSIQLSYGRVFYLVSIRKRSFSALAVSIIGLACDSASGLALRAARSCQLSLRESLRRIRENASAQPLDFLVRTKNPSFPN